MAIVNLVVLDEEDYRRLQDGDKWIHDLDEEYLIIVDEAKEEEVIEELSDRFGIDDVRDV